jgi:cobyrinic acid a,c-diamide synthase
VTRHCPALLVTAPASGNGKTSVTAAIARYHRQQGRRVRCFKTGPDFIDPTILLQASGLPVYNLDSWIMGDDHCRRLLWEAAGDADLILVEGVMGLYDGTPSSADLARLFGLPILPVINAAAMAQTFGAVVHGLATWQPGLRLAGAVGNRVASARHIELLREAMPAGVPLSTLAPQPHASLPERHLGLQLAAEIHDLNARLDRLAAAIAETPLAQLPPPVAFEEVDAAPIEPLLQGLTVAVACDHAFCFLYQANLEWLQKMGARVAIFSPLEDDHLPDADAIYLPGGYPELYADQLAENEAMREAILDHVDDDLPLLAECGGMLYLAETLRDLDGREFEMLGVLPARATMGEKLAAIGSQQLLLPAGDDGEPQSVRGHTFHYSSLQCELAPAFRAQTQDGSDGEAVYIDDAVVASYLHWYFPSNPAQIARWLTPR